MSLSEEDRQRSDLELLNRVGFTRPYEQTIVLDFARERDLSVAALLRVALIDYQLRAHPLYDMLMKGKPFGCPDLGD